MLLSYNFITENTAFNKFQRSVDSPLDLTLVCGVKLNLFSDNYNVKLDMYKNKGNDSKFQLIVKCSTVSYHNSI